MLCRALPALDAGGVERGTLEIAEALVGRGNRSIVISAGGRLVTDLINEGSEHVYVPIGKKSPLTFRHVPWLRKFLRENRVSILHARSRLPAWICYMAWRGMDPFNRPRFVTSVHGPYSVNRYSKIMVSGEKVIAVSNYIKTYISENYPDIEAANIVTIPRGINTREFEYGHRPAHDWLTRWYDEFPQTKDRFIITLPARLTRWKGHAEFFRIFTLLKEDNYVHGLVVGGADPGKEAYLSELKEKVQQLGLQQKISFTGHRRDIREIMSVSDIVLSLSTEPEAFGRTTLEALSLGIPVIAYDHGGISEIMRAIFPAGLVSIGDTGAASKLIMSFRRHKPEVSKNNPFTLKRMQSDTLDLYESLVHDRPLITN